MVSTPVKKGGTATTPSSRKPTSSSSSSSSSSKKTKVQNKTTTTSSSSSSSTENGSTSSSLFSSSFSSSPSSSVSSRIAKLIDNTTPSEYDPEGVDLFGDAINLPEASGVNYAELDKSSKGKELGAPLRRAVDTSRISSSVGKYAGKRSSRSEHDDDEVQGEEEEDDDEGMIEDDEEIPSGSDLEEEEEEEEGGFGEDEEYSNGGSDMDAMEGESENVEYESGGSEDEGVIVQQHAQNDDDELTKAIHTRNQLQLWDSIMASRIQLQSELSMAMKFPQKDMYQVFASEPATVQLFENIQTELAKALDNLVTLQEQLLINNPQTNYTPPPSSSERLNRKRPRSDDGDEEDNDNDNDDNVITSCEAWWDIIHPLNTSFGQYCGTVMDKWSGRVLVESGKVFTKKFQSLNQGFMAQIESLFSDRERMVKRTTRIKRESKIFGKTTHDEYDDEIYDDTDFYQTLLKELIANGAIGAGNSTDYWHEISDIKKTKTKNKHAKNASKGKMINYDVQDKLVNFMAPDDRPLPCEWNLSELFTNLFGGNGSSSNKKPKTKSGA